MWQHRKYGVFAAIAVGAIAVVLSATGSDGNILQQDPYNEGKYGQKYDYKKNEGKYGQKYDYKKNYGKYGKKYDQKNDHYQHGDLYCDKHTCGAVYTACMEFAESYCKHGDDSCWEKYDCWRHEKDCYQLYKGSACSSKKHLRMLWGSKSSGDCCTDLCMDLHKGCKWLEKSCYGVAFKCFRACYNCHSPDPCVVYDNHYDNEKHGKNWNVDYHQPKNPPNPKPKPTPAPPTVAPEGPPTAAPEGPPPKPKPTASPPKPKPTSAPTPPQHPPRHQSNHQPRHQRYNLNGNELSTVYHTRASLMDTWVIHILSLQENAMRIHCASLH